MRYAELRLRPPLHDAVECVWMLERDGAPGAAFDTIVPDGCPELIFQLADPFESEADGRVALQPGAFLMGASRGPLRLRPTRRVRTVGVRFRPGGLAAVLRVPAHELTGRGIPLSDLFGAEARALAEDVAGSRGLHDARARVQRFLLGRLRPRAGMARTAVRAILHSRGRSTVDALAGGAGVSTRHLERLFQDEVGLSPKRLLRVARLQEVLRRLEGAPQRWVDVALDCGYADQAHLTREFRELAGESPARWTAGELAAGFTAPARLDAFFRDA